MTIDSWTSVALRQSCSVLSWSWSWSLTCQRPGRLPRPAGFRPDTHQISEKLNLTIDSDKHHEQEVFGTYGKAKKKTLHSSKHNVQRSLFVMAADRTGFSFQKLRPAGESDGKPSQKLPPVSAGCADAETLAEGETRRHWSARRPWQRQRPQFVTIKNKDFWLLVVFQ